MGGNLWASMDRGNFLDMIAGIRTIILPLWLLLMLCTCSEPVEGANKRSFRKLSQQQAVQHQKTLDNTKSKFKSPSK
jgi:hypothetical protein